MNNLTKSQLAMIEKRKKAIADLVQMKTLPSNKEVRKKYKVGKATASSYLRAAEDGPYKINHMMKLWRTA